MPVEGLDQLLHSGGIFDAQSSEELPELGLAQPVACLKAGEAETFPNQELAVELQIFCKVEIRWCCDLGAAVGICKTKTACSPSCFTCLGMLMGLA